MCEALTTRSYPSLIVGPYIAPTNSWLAPSMPVTPPLMLVEIGKPADTANPFDMQVDAAPES